MKYFTDVFCIHAPIDSKYKDISSIWLLPWIKHVHFDRMLSQWDMYLSIWKLPIVLFWLFYLLLKNDVILHWTSSFCDSTADCIQAGPNTFGPRVPQIWRNFFWCFSTWKNWDLALWNIFWSLGCVKNDKNVKLVKNQVFEGIVAISPKR